MQRDFSLASLCQALFPELLGAHLHICRSQELKSLWGSLLAPYGSWKTVASTLKQGPDPQKNTMAVRVAKLGWELGTFALPSTTNLTNYGAKS